MVGLAVGEDDDHLLGILPGAHTGAMATAVKDVLRQIQAVVHAGGAGGFQVVDRVLKGRCAVAAHVRQVLDDLGVVIAIPVNKIVADLVGFAVVSELDDTDLMRYVIRRTGFSVAAPCVDRHLVDEAVDRGLQSSETVNVFCLL